MAQIHVGTSGWNYGPWKDTFYAGVKRPLWLRHYATRFGAVELNASFYRFVKPETYAGWGAATPGRFRFAIKGHRAITHMQRLADAADLIARQRDAAAALGPRLAAVLWQLPRGFARDLPRLEAFLEALGAWTGPRHVFEFRHRSWFEDDTAALLGRRGAASAISDAGTWPRWDAVTADLVYVRLHGRPHTYISAYGEAALARWAARAHGWLADGRDVHVYFDNTMRGAAPNDALGFLALFGDKGDPISEVQP